MKPDKDKKKQVVQLAALKMKWHDVIEICDDLLNELTEQLGDLPDTVYNQPERDELLIEQDALKFIKLTNETILSHVIIDTAKSMQELSSIMVKAKGASNGKTQAKAQEPD